MQIIYKTIKWLFTKLFGSKLYSSIKIDDVPEVIDAKKIYLIGEDGYMWFAVMLCPCGCEEILYMNLLPDQRPRWSFSEHKDGTISIHPSINRKVGCGSHFWVKYGKIIWHKDNC